MKKHYLSALFVFLSVAVFSQRTVRWVSTTEQKPWVEQKQFLTVKTDKNADVAVNTASTLQTIEGFGGCFNEFGWTSLNTLNAKDRESILKELFAPNVGANFTVCRMPVGANDFSIDWYSYDETDGDFALKNFSIAHDQETLIPFIKDAKKQNPSLKIWASPWSPPAWMKWNKHYACNSPIRGIHTVQNGLDSTKQGKEGTNMFIQKDEYFKVYALYFSKFIQDYKKEGINIYAIMPQNEFNSCQIFPSCTWTASGLATFIGKYLGPEMSKQKVEIMFGTMERPAEALVDTILNDKSAGKYIKGIGFQWAGKGAIAGLHKRYPNLKLYQSEQECGDGKNDWEFCRYAWRLMKHYIDNGASAYMYWNISLPEGGISRWGWQQNSLVTVDLNAKTFKYNHEFYLLKHVSHFVKPGAKLIKTDGSFGNLLAFKNPDKSIVVVVQNEEASDKKLTIKVDNEMVEVLLTANSFNTLLIK